MLLERKIIVIIICLRYDEMSIEIDLCCNCFDKMMKEYVEPKLKFKNEAIKDYC